MPQRQLFRDLLLEKMKDNDDIYLLLGGVGYGFYEPDGKRIINCEASEQAMIDMAVGLAMSGKIPFVYSITPHLFRAFEGIRIYLDYYQFPVKLIGIGRDNEYGDLGFTHWATGDKLIFETLNGIISEWPTEEELTSKFVNNLVETPKPFYVNLSRY